MGVTATKGLGPQDGRPDQKVGSLGGPFGSTVISKNCFQKFRRLSGVVISFLPPEQKVQSSTPGLTTGVGREITVHVVGGGHEVGDGKI